MTYPLNSRDLTCGSISEADVDAARRVIQSLNGMFHPTVGDPIAVADTQSLTKLAVEMKKAREVRAQVFDPELFGEPAWDMMLALFIAHGEQYRLKVSDLTFESNVPSTTALRWMKTLFDQGLARKVSNPRDSRSSFVEFTELGLAQMTTVLTQIAAKRGQGRSIAGL